MPTKCEACPVRPGTTCAGETHPAICARAADPAEAAFRGRLGRRSAGGAGFPSLVERAGNLAGAVARFVASGGATTTAKERERRLGVCRACDQFADGWCMRCGCNLPLKVASASEHCPLPDPRW